MTAAGAVPIAPLPGDGQWHSHAVSRSSELLSCAKTALKIAKSQHAHDDDYDGTMWWACQQPTELALCVWKDDQDDPHQQGSSRNNINMSQLDGLCEDGLSLLRTMDAELTQLESLVRRRGHTNDPTEEIAASVRRLETDAKELSALVKTGFRFPRANAQYQRHTQLIASWLESVAQQQTSKLKEILKVRGNVLADQAQRRKLLNPQGPTNKDSKNSSTTHQQQNHHHHASSSNGGSSSSNGPAASSSSSGAAHHHPVLISEPAHKRAAPKAMDTPLFTMTPLPKPGAATYRTTNSSSKANNNNNNNNNKSSATNGNNHHPNSAPLAGFTANKSTASSSAGGGPTPYGRSASSGFNAPSVYGGGAGAGGSSGGGGYGGYGGGSVTSSYYGGVAASTGMRQRRPRTGGMMNGQQQQQEAGERDEQEEIQAQIQMRQQQRQTEQRLQDAQQAEQTLAHLGTMFNKMTNLITQQGEVLEKVEDDVEAGLAEVEAGQQEITKLYGLKKGNRGLIIKVFSLLIFFIIFMRFYKK